MHPRSQEFVDRATSIATTGRWSAVNAKIETLAANPDKGNEWYVQVFAFLCCELFSEYLAIKREYENPQHGDVSLLAWRARNLLELQVWSVYCATSRDNARRLFEDAGRDSREFFDLYLNWGTANQMAADWLDPIEATKKDLQERARLIEGIESLDGSYKRVDRAAEECGFGDSFKVFYRTLSKFAHPTALRIIGVSDERMTAGQRDVFYSDGCMFFTDAFDALEKQILSS